MARIYGSAVRALSSRCYAADFGYIVWQLTVRDPRPPTRANQKRENAKPPPKV